MKDITALVLAGGKGTRFHPYTELIPKPMIPIGMEERPVLEFIVRWLTRFEIRDIVMLLNHRWRYIKNYFNAGERFGANIKYSIDDPDGYTNTGGAIYKAISEGLVKKRALIWYGDILAKIDLNDLIAFHERNASELTLVVSNKYSVPVGIVELDEEKRVRKMTEKPELDINATIGVALMETEVFSSNVVEELGKSFDLMGDMVPLILKKERRVYAYVYDGIWYDVGSLERYKKINAENLDREFNFI
ncbi:MAG: nucleotidyltransferase family protein [Fervidicoccaceae archaeon]